MPNNKITLELTERELSLLRTSVGLYYTLSGELGSEHEKKDLEALYVRLIETEAIQLTDNPTTDQYKQAIEQNQVTTLGQREGKTAYAETYTDSLLEQILEEIKQLRKEVNTKQ